uniref:Putative secreted protein n=1 Tax=Ixodes ricinus TaxID=34613 RepID=A0A6B0TS98_IXORI
MTTSISQSFVLILISSTHSPRMQASALCTALMLRFLRARIFETKRSCSVPEGWLPFFFFPQGVPSTTLSLQ